MIPADVGPVSRSPLNFIMSSASDSDHFPEDEDDETPVRTSPVAASASRPGLDLAGFLFGNVDEEGKLSEETAHFLDEDTRGKLGGLSQMLEGQNGLGEMLLGEEAQAKVSRTAR